MSVLPLRLVGATLERRGARLVGPIDWTLSGEGTTVILGPNGAGKTSLLRLIGGLGRPASGSLAWGAPDAEARRALSFVFQRPVMMRRSVLASIAYPLRIGGMGRREARARAEAQAERFGLGAKLRQSAPSLSGGEMQKLALARALVTGPQLLLLDEPTAALDGRATAEIEAHLAAAARAGTRIVLATHDMGQAERLGTEAVFVLGGRLHERAGADEFFAGPATAEAAAFLRGDIVV